MFLGLVAWLHVSEPRLAAVQEPERALALVVERTLELEAAAGRAPRWERRFYTLTLVEGAGELPQAIDWYEELAAWSPSPDVELRLAILYGEAGRLDRLRAALDGWPPGDPGFQRQARLVSAAYLDGPASPAAGLSEVLGRALPPGWFHSRLALRLAAGAGDPALHEVVQAAIEARAAALLARLRVVIGCEAAVLALGAAAAWSLARRRRPGARRVATAPLPPPWSGRAALTALVRGGAAGAVLAALAPTALRWGHAAHPLLDTLDQPLIYLPLLVIAHRSVLAPAGLGFASGLGLKPAPGGGRRLALWIAALAAAGVVLDLALGLLLEGAGATTHWTEWFDPDLAWGSPAAVAATVVGAAVFAPLFEEIVFRGLLYGALRRRLAAGPAAVASAVVFAVLHGYGVAGLAGVFASGLLWAWAYERTGSLLPAVAAHAVNNLAVALTLLWLLRG